VQLHSSAKLAVRNRGGGRLGRFLGMVFILLVELPSCWPHVLDDYAHRDPGGFGGNLERAQRRELLLCLRGRSQSLYDGMHERSWRTDRCICSIGWAHGCRRCCSCECNRHRCGVNGALSHKRGVRGADNLRRCVRGHFGELPDAAGTGWRWPLAAWAHRHGHRNSPNFGRANVGCCEELAGATRIAAVVSTVTARRLGCQKRDGMSFREMRRRCKRAPSTRSPV
jgi:hypothetical protein